MNMHIYTQFFEHLIHVDGCCVYYIHCIVNSVYSTLVLLFLPLFSEIVQPFLVQPSNTYGLRLSRKKFSISIGQPRTIDTVPKNHL